MSNKIFTLVSIKVVILVGVVRPWPYENITNHHHHNVNSRSYLSSMMMMNDLCELPLDQLLKVKKSLHDLQLSAASLNSPNTATLQSREGNAAEMYPTESRSIADHGYNKVNYDSNSISSNTDLHHQPHFNRFAV